MRNLLRGSGRYRGRPMPKHMAIPELGDAHFIRWLALFRQTAEEICPPEVAQLFIERSERVGNSFRLNIALRRGESVIHGCGEGVLWREPIIHRYDTHA